MVEGFVKTKTINLEGLLPVTATNNMQPLWKISYKRKNNAFY